MSLADVALTSVLCGLVVVLFVALLFVGRR